MHLISIEKPLNNIKLRASDCAKDFSILSSLHEIGVIHRYEYGEIIIQEKFHQKFFYPTALQLVFQVELN